ncbi:MAG TPA: hypothetical protein VFH60_08800 [Chloroflexia bacterium]|nr:hypothetical protein [Chloroflexia bacterium]
MMNPSPGRHAIIVSLAPTMLILKPNMEQVELTLDVRNAGDVVDQYRVEIDGIEESWYRITVPKVSLFPGDSAQIPILINAPQGAKLTAGQYTFEVRVISQDSPTTIVSANGVILVEAMSDFQVEMEPRRVLGRQGKFRVTVMNLGNSSMQVALSGRDPEEGLQYIFQDPEPELEAGRSKLVPLEVKARGLHFVGSNRSYPFTVSASAVDGPTGQDGRAMTRVTQAEFVRTPILRSLRPLLFLLLLLLLILLIFFIRPDLCKTPLLGNVFCPAPPAAPLPTIESITVDPPSISPGEAVTLSWITTNAITAEVKLGAELISTQPIDETGQGQQTITGVDRSRAVTLCVYNVEAKRQCSNSQVVVLPTAVVAGNPTPPGGDKASQDQTATAAAGGAGGNGGGNGGNGGAGGPQAQTATAAARANQGAARTATRTATRVPPRATATATRVPPTRAPATATRPVATRPPATATLVQPNLTATTIAAATATAAAGGACNPITSPDGEAVPNTARPGDTILFTARGFEPNEPASFFLTRPDGVVGGTDNPVEGGVDANGVIGPIEFPLAAGFSRFPGRWALTFVGANSNRTVIIVFCVNP